MKQLLARAFNTRVQTKLVFSLTLLILLQSAVQLVFYNWIATRQITEYARDSAVDALEKNTALADTILYAALSSLKSYNVDPDLIRLQEGVGEVTFAYEAMVLERNLYNRYFWDLDSVIVSVHLVSPQQNSTFQDIVFTFDDFRRAYPDYGSFGVDVQWIPTHPAAELRGCEDRDVFSIVRLLTPSIVYFDAMQVMPESLPSPYIVINLDPDAVFDYYRSSQTVEGSSFFITTREGEWVYGSIPSHGAAPSHGVAPSNGAVGSPAAHPWFDDALEGSGSGIYDTPWGKSLICHTSSELSGWLAFQVIPVKQLTDDLYTTANLVAFLIIACALVVLVLIYALSSHFMRPVHQLAGFARRLSAGELDPGEQMQPVPGELGVISGTIQQLNGWLKELMEQNSAISQREQDATIAALEMQLNPHFLFNTLNTVNLLAIRNSQPEISRIILDLSGMLHYSLDQHNRFVQLSDELEFLKKYVSLMQARFTSGFLMEYDIEPGLERCIIPKMILQIPVENAILHGIREIPRQGRIAVRARQREEQLILQVEDNGKGIPPDRIRVILSKRKNHIGFSNVNQRLKLLFGDTYGIRIPSPGNPTIVEIAMPLIKNAPLPPPFPGGEEQADGL